MSNDNDVQERIVTVWEKVLGHADFAIEDDFFAVGGDSLRAVILLRALSSEGIDVVLPQFMRNSTVAGLTALACGYDNGDATPRISRLPR